MSGLAPDGNGGSLAIVDGRSLRRRTAGREWRTIAVSEVDLSCCVAVGDGIYVGTDDAHVLRIGANGKLEPLAGLDEIPGRDSWYARTALIDGQLVGPPLGIRSMTATCDDAVLLVNVHVAGIPRSSDGGVTWQPTIAIEHDVHQVCAHPARPDIVVASGSECSRQRGCRRQASSRTDRPYSRAHFSTHSRASAEHHCSPRASIVEELTSGPSASRSAADCRTTERHRQRLLRRRAVLQWTATRDLSCLGQP